MLGGAFRNWKDLKIGDGRTVAKAARQIAPEFVLFFRYKQRVVCECGF